MLDSTDAQHTMSKSKEALHLFSNFAFNSITEIHKKLRHSMEIEAETLQDFIDGIDHVGIDEASHAATKICKLMALYKRI